MIEVIRPGLQTTVQDLGRSGSRHLGICQSGALDDQALKTANILVGNSMEAAGLEIATGPVELECHSDSVLALTGADFNASVMTAGSENTKALALAPGWRFQLQRGERLLLKGNRSGGRAYIAFAGGLKIATTLGSCATDIAAGFGGLNGRCLQSGDQLAINPPTAEIANSYLTKWPYPKKWDIGCRQTPPGHTIRVLPSNNAGLFSAVEHQRFFQSDWQISTASNRMGARLQGATIKTQAGHNRANTVATAANLRSHAVMPGTVQVPRNGKPIVLLADGQTTGGYPKIGQVIQADLCKLAQLGFDMMFRFVPCTMAQAIAARAAQQQELFRLQQAVSYYDGRKR